MEGSTFKTSFTSPSFFDRVKPEITTTCLQRPPFLGPIFTLCNLKLPLNNDYLSTTATNLGSLGWSLDTGLTVLSKKYYFQSSWCFLASMVRLCHIWLKGKSRSRLKRPNPFKFHLNEKMTEKLYKVDDQSHTLVYEHLRTRNSSKKLLKISMGNYMKWNIYILRRDFSYSKNFFLFFSPSSRPSRTRTNPESRSSWVKCHK